MESLNQILQVLIKLLDWYVLVMPWEQGVLVRLGKYPKLIEKGIHFKIPFLDRVFVQESRTRLIDLPMQTLSTKDNRTLTIKPVVTYHLVDIMLTFNTLAHPEMTLSGIVLGYLSDYVSSKTFDELNKMDAEKFAQDSTDAKNFGLSDIDVKITSWTEVPALRLLQDYSYLVEGMNLSSK